jgi:myo-inositol-1(or 4)-monophosphatase
VKQYLDAAVDVARMAGARADHWFFQRDKLVVEEKGAQDYVSQADRKTEELIVAELRQRFPDHAFLGEEGAKETHAKSGQPTWVIDPIDGTTNFLHGIPLYAISIGLVVDGEPVVGVIHLPRQDELFTASRGGGAHLWNAKIAAAKTSAMNKAVIAVGSSTRTGREKVNDIRTKVSEAGAEIRRLGSACVETAYVACGRLDGYLEAHLNAWDVAAGLIILREAGARVNTFDSRSDWLASGNAFVCAAPGVYDSLSAICAFE